MEKTPSILYLDFRPGVDVHRRKLDGIRRYADARGWTVATLTRDILEKDESALRAALSRFQPIGCIAEDSGLHRPLPPESFGKLPVVYLDPPEILPWRGAATVSCDNAAVAATAFRELSAGHPPAYAVVPFFLPHKWALDRADAFRALCRKAGKPCLMFEACQAENPKQFIAWVHARLSHRRRVVANYLKRLAAWVATLPPHCAIFAVNDTTAQDTAAALVAARRPLPRTATLVGADAAAPAPESGDVPQISSVEIDFELAGFLAARLLTETMTGRAAHGKTTAAVAANDDALRANDQISSLPPSVARHCTEGARHCAAQPRPSLVSPLFGRGETFGPLLVDRRATTRGHGRHEHFILSAVEMIRREACDGLTPTALAARFPCTRRLFDLRFREAMGHTAFDEIEQIRLERVFTLLRDTEKPIGAIAAFCGYGSDIALRWAFRTRVGMSMREWRARNRP